MKNIWFSLLLPFSLAAIDYTPWFDKAYDFEGRVETEVQWGSGHLQLVHNEASLKIATASHIRAELELDGFSSQRYHYNQEAFKASCQYLVMNDRVGDFLSVVGGATLILPFSKAKRAKTLFYPGSTEGEFHLSIGKEQIEGSEALSSAWARFAVGCASRGPMWFRFNAEYLKRLGYRGCVNNYGEAGFIFRTLNGGSTRSIELGLKGRWILEEFFDDWDGIVTLTYFRRPYARRLPTVSSIALEYDFIF